MLPAAIQRADNVHILASGCVALGFAPAALLELVGPGWRRATAAKVTAGVVGLLCGIGLVHASGPTVCKNEVLGIDPHNPAYDVNHRGRSFPIVSQPVARSLNSLLPKLDAMAAPGESVFVGPVNLRLTNYNDTFLYYLLSDLRPASFYTELNAGVANSPDSSLAADLRKADFLLLTTRWDNWDEPNDSTNPGSTAPLRVVRRNFCEVARRGSYRLLRRCTRGA